MLREKKDIGKYKDRQGDRRISRQGYSRKKIKTNQQPKKVVYKPNT